MKTSLLILAFLFASLLHGQTMSDIRKLLEERDFQQFKRYIDNGAPNPPKSNVTARWRLLRDVIPGYQEGLVEIEENFGSLLINIYRINLLSEGNNIFYYQFGTSGFVGENAEGGSEAIDSIISSYNDKNKYTAFEKAFHRNYNTDLVKNDLFRYIIFGDGCGITGSPPEYRKILDGYIKDKNTDAIHAWLTSANTEKQLYALEGLNELAKTGHSPTREDLRIATIIYHKKGSVNTCSGCIVSDDAIHVALKDITPSGPSNSLAILIVGVLAAPFVVSSSIKKIKNKVAKKQ